MPSARAHQFARFILLSVAALLLAPSAQALPPLQLYVELTAPGEVLTPPPGEYAGPVVIDKPIILDGQGEVTLDGGGDGTVLSIEADGASVRNMHITGSGESHNGVDAGVLIEADDTTVEDNRMDDVLFGVHIKGGNRNTIRGNTIRSKPTKASLRGDGVRMWYGRENAIERNTFIKIRDLMITNSANNRIVGNTIRNSQVGIEFVYSPDNLVRDNTFSRNSTGVIVLYSDGIVLRGNRLEHIRSASGRALAIKESSKVLMEDNEIIHCTIGLAANDPTHPENVFHARGNRFAYNNIAMYFYGETGGHVLEGNRFENNLVNVAVSAPVAARFNTWRGNYWDDYQGFDRDGDGIGDVPHEIYAYADMMWMDWPWVSFFRASPVLEMIDFVERLAPFSEPPLVLRDPAPRVR